MKDQFKLLLVDDEEDILLFIKYNLEKEGFLVETAVNGELALQLVSSFKPHLILLDIMMPGMDGFEVCEKIKRNKENSDILICFLTARSESFTQINALDNGADDFITKPIKPKVLTSRIKAILRRHPSNYNIEEKSLKSYGELKINFDTYEVYLSDEKVSLSKKEFNLLKLITSKPGKVFSRTEIFNKVWGHDTIVGDRTIDVHIRKLREKIGSNYIQTMKGVGYKFDF